MRTVYDSDGEAYRLQDTDACKAVSTGSYSFDAPDAPAAAPVMPPPPQMPPTPEVTAGVPPTPPIMEPEVAAEPA